jgi:Clostridial hydrophobic W
LRSLRGDRHTRRPASARATGVAGLVGEGRIAGNPLLMRRMEAFTLRAPSGSGLGIAYQAHVAGIGWMPEVRDGRVAGTTGQGRQMEAVRIRLVNPRAGQHVCYQAYVAGLRWLPPVCDGAVGGTTGQGTEDGSPSRLAHPVSRGPYGGRGRRAGWIVDGRRGARRVC